LLCFAFILLFCYIWLTIVIDSSLSKKLKKKKKIS
jgi:hypothetical protein